MKHVCVCGGGGQFGGDRGVEDYSGPYKANRTGQEPGAGGAGGVCVCVGGGPGGGCDKLINMNSMYRSSSRHSRASKVGGGGGCWCALEEGHRQHLCGLHPHSPMVR